MASTSLRMVIRRIGRVILLVTLGYPQLIVAVPLLVWLCAHGMSTWLKPGPSIGWRPVDLIRGIGFSMAAFLFAFLAILHLAAVIYVGWKGHGAVYRRGSWSAVTRPWLHGVITEEQLLARLDDLSRTRGIVGPVARAEPDCSPPIRYFYQPVKSAGELALDFTCSTYSPKARLFPPRETLFEFDKTNGRFQTVVRIDDKPMALIGVHPCDIHAMRLLDEVFTRDHRDEHYLTRRRNTFIVGIDCPVPCSPKAYCRDMHTDSADQGFDVMLYPLKSDEISADKESSGAVRVRFDGVQPPSPAFSGSNLAGPDGASTLEANPRKASGDYGIVFGTEAGRKWLNDADGRTVREPTVDDERRFERYLDRKHSAFPTRLTSRIERFPAILADSYDSLVWEATSQRCYSCGSCNLVCPTCYCFDIRDDADLSGRRGMRERTWDGCMLKDFALVAGGHNFRSKPVKRLRHRIYRKATWIEQRTGLAGCVGCARCEHACTAHISMVEILNQLDDEHRGAPLVGTGASKGSPGD